MAKTIQAILQLKDNFSSTVKKINGTTKETQRQVKTLNNTVDKFKQKAVDSFTSVAKKAIGLTAGLAGVAGAAAAIGTSFSFMNNYKDSMNDLQIQTGATGEELLQLKEIAKALYTENIGESFEDISNSLALAKQMTDQTGEALKETTRNAIIFKDAFHFDEEEIIKTIDTMTKQFGITSTEAFNLLAQGQQKGLNKSGDMLDVINEYSNQFKVAGYSASEMFDVLSAGGKSGAFSIDKVGDAIKELNIRMKDGSNSSTEAYEMLGLNAEKMTMDYAKGGESAKKAMATVFKALENMKDPVVQNAAAVGLFGTQFEDLETQVIFSMGNAEKVFDQTIDTMKSVKEVKYDSVGAAFRGIKRDVETSLLIPLSEKLLPKLNEFSEWIKSHMPQIKNEIEYAFKVGGKIVDGFKDAIQKLKDNAGWLIPVVAGLTGAIVAQKVVSTVSDMYKKWTGITKGLTTAQKLFNIVLSANPFGKVAWIIGILITLGVLLWKNWDAVKAKAVELWEKIRETWNNLKDYTQEVWTNISNWLGSFEFGRFLLETIHSLVDNVKAIFNNLIDFFKNVFAGNWRGAWENIVNIFKHEFELIKTYAKTPLNALIEMLNYVIRKANKIQISMPDWAGGNTFGVNIPEIPKLATGSNYFSGGRVEVGEHGGEILDLPNGTKVIPNDISKRMATGSGGGVNVYVTVQGNVIGNEQYADEMGNHIAKRVMLALGNV